MTISMIAAMSKNRVIGKNNDLPWHLPDDFKFFKDKTRGHHVIMGRKNYESLPPKFRPLPDRVNIVLTRQPDFHAEGCIIVDNLGDAIEIARKSSDAEPFIIGGGEIYRQGIALANRIYLTEIDAEIEGDTYFPELDHSIWKEVFRIPHPADDRHAFRFDFVTYEKV